MSKKVKNLIEKQIEADLQGIDGIAVINPRGINAIKNKDKGKNKAESQKRANRSHAFYSTSDRSGRRRRECCIR